MAETDNAAPKKTALEDWYERQYMAFVNFLRKRDLFEDWKRFKAAQPDKEREKLMLEFLKRC